jgi:hypothetical protein
LPRLVSALTVVTVFALLFVGVVRSASTAELTASWVDHSAGKAAFEVDRRVEGDGRFWKVGDVPAGYSSFTDAKVAEGVTYCYRVRAYDAFGASPYSEEACGSTGSSESSAFRVSITKSGSGSGIVASAPSGILCGNDCAGAYSAGRVVFLNATPSAGSKFVGWSGGCSGTRTCTVTGNTMVAVTAWFSRIQ